ncbi:PD-(D/E)XK nuclease family transposase [uncultured Eubacterium sp.]|nr:PD-(D/E)XK nuclease family transposase [uncultured Eubacterium sp.]
MVNSALEEGEDYDKMKKSIVISFVDKVLFPDIPGIHTRFLVKEEQTGHPLTDRLILHFIELGKVSADRAVEDLDPLERFAAYMKYCSDPQKEDYVNQLLDSGEEAVQMSEHVYKKVTESDLAREMLEREEKAAHDIATMKVHARREGLAEGRAEDIVAGVQQVKRALRLSAEGKTPEEIAAELDLTIEIVREMLDLEAVIE